MNQLEAILTCERCGDVAEVRRVPAQNQGVYEHRIKKLNPCRYGFKPAKCPHVARKPERQQAR